MVPTLLLPPAMPFTLHVAFTTAPAPVLSENAFWLPGTTAVRAGDTAVFASMFVVPVGSGEEHAAMPQSTTLQNPARKARARDSGY